MVQMFKDINANDFLSKQGFVKHGKINNTAIEQLIQLNEKLKIKNSLDTGYNVSMNIYDKELRKVIQGKIIEIVAPFALDLLIDCVPYAATTHNKVANKNILVPAHQDFSYTNEQNIPPIMCWIPLVNVDIKNAALGFIPKSHLLYNYICAFPFPFAKTPITENSTRLMNYFDIIKMEAGEMVFFNHNIIHGSFPNYTNKDRLAVGLKFTKKEEKIYTYIHNPKTYGKTILKYEVERDFIAENNNTSLFKMYNDGTIMLSEKLIDEFDYQILDPSWNKLELKLNKLKIYPKQENIDLLSAIKKKSKKEKIKNILFKLLSNFK